MSATKEEIARDLLVAAIAGKPGTITGEYLGQQFAVLLTAIGEASRAESAATSRYYENN